MFTKRSKKGQIDLYKKETDWDAVAGAIVIGLIVLAIIFS